MLNNLEIVSVNFNTPDLTERLIYSVLKREGKYPTRIIDGSNKEPYISQIKEVCKKYNYVQLEQFGYNIHHGRGLDYAISSSAYDWVMCMDSDNYFIKPVLEAMYFATLEHQKKMCGYYCYVDESMTARPDRLKDTNHQILYFHPSMLLINKKYYMEMSKENVKFMHHGAPSIRIAKYMHGKDTGLKLDVALGFDYKDIGQYVNLESRGTVNRFGYNL